MRGLVPTLHKMYGELKSKVDFLCVYIAEAHGQDEWPISSCRFNNGKVVKYNQPKTIEERLAIAADFVAAFQFELPLVVDEISNPFEKEYAPWPIRFFVLQNKKIQYIAEPKNCSYDVGQLRLWLLNRI